MCSFLLQKWRLACTPCCIIVSIIITKGVIMKKSVFLYIIFLNTNIFCSEVLTATIKEKAQVIGVALHWELNPYDNLFDVPNKFLEENIAYIYTQNIESAPEIQASIATLKQKIRQEYNLYQDLYNNTRRQLDQNKISVDPEELEIFILKNLIGFANIPKKTPIEILDIISNIIRTIKSKQQDLLNDNIKLSSDESSMFKYNIAKLLLNEPNPSVAHQKIAALLDDIKYIHNASQEYQKLGFSKGEYTTKYQAMKTQIKDQSKSPTLYKKHFFINLAHLLRNEIEGLKFIHERINYSPVPNNIQPPMFDEIEGLPSQMQRPIRHPAITHHKIVKPLPIRYKDANLIAV